MSDGFSVVPSISTGLGLAGFLAALVATVVRHKINEKARLIRQAKPEDRARLVEDALEFFHVDTAGLTKEQRFTIALEQIKARSDRFGKGVLLAAFLVLIAACVATLAMRHPHVASASVTDEQRQVLNMVSGSKDSNPPCRSDSSPSSVQPFENGWLLFSPIRARHYAIVRTADREVEYRTIPDSSDSNMASCPGVPGEELLQWGFRQWYCKDPKLREKLGKPLAKELVAWVQYQEWDGGLLIASLPWRTASFEYPDTSNHAGHGRFYEMDAIFLEKNSSRGAFVPFTYKSFAENAWCTSLWWRADRTQDKNARENLASEERQNCQSIVPPDRYTTGGPFCSVSGR